MKSSQLIAELLMCIKETSTLEERKERSIEKDKKFIRVMKNIAYKDDGELFLNNLKYANTEKIRRQDDYQLIT